MPMNTGKIASAASRLAQSTSPYLRQHANNPVEWYQWGEEAFKAARSQNKPIFVSIGYSTCHWCHVMAHESFEDEEIAKIMNENFVNVKVDREERPDLDRQYMKYVQATTGTGGWPLSVFLSPTLKPIYGGTYFPARDDAFVGRPSFKSILEIITQSWRDDWRSLERKGANILEQLKRMADVVPTGSDHGGHLVRIKSIQKAFLQLSQTFDSEYAGFGSLNKFPMPGTLGMLLRYWALWRDLDREAEDTPLSDLRQNFEGITADEAKLKALWRETVDNGMKMAGEAKEMVFFTLIRMARGGIHDHVAGGFHRYTVDRAWTLPHFEKMLYDQAQVIKIYSEAFLVFDRHPEFESVVHKAVEYVKDRLLCEKTGAFFAAEDADSLNRASGRVEEGAFAVWKDEEINELLFKSAGWPLEDVKVFKYHYTLLPRGNLANLTSDPDLKTANVLLERADSQMTAEKLERPRDEVEDILNRGLAILKAHRETERPFPGRDEKIVTSWNGLMISALATAARVFEKDEYLEMARSAWNYILKNICFKDVNDDRVKVWRSFYAGESSGIEGFAEDYANLIAAALEMHQSTLEEAFLTTAEELHETLDALFRDKAGGGYYDCLPSADGWFRSKDCQDAVEPSANSLTALNCIKMNLLTGKKVYLERFRQILRLFTKQLDKEPHSMTTLVSAIIMDSSKPTLLTLNDTKAKAEATGIIMEAVGRNFLPHLLIKVDKNDQKFNNKEEKQEKEESIGHVCKGNVCGAPLNEPSAILKELGI